MLTVSEAAKRARLSARLIYQLCDEKRLPHYRIGSEGRRGKILIAEKDLDAFVEQCRIEPLVDDNEASYQRHLR